MRHVTASGPPRARVCDRYATRYARPCALPPTLCAGKYPVGLCSPVLIGGTHLWNQPERVVVTMTKAELADFARALVQEVLGCLDAAERLHSDEPQIATGTLSANLPGHEVAVGGIPIKLKTREFALLAALAQNLGRVLTQIARGGVARPASRRRRAHRGRPRSSGTCRARNRGVTHRDRARRRLQTCEGGGQSRNRAVNVRRPRRRPGAGDLGPECVRRIANRVFAETKTRYGVNAVATLMTVDCGEMR